MYLEIVTPEKVLLTAEVVSVTLPGIDGEFQLLNNHAAIVSVLTEGDIKVEGNITPKEGSKATFEKTPDGKIIIHIKGGVLEMKNNKAIVLAN